MNQGQKCPFLVNIFEYPLSTGNCQNKKMTVSIFLVFMYKNNFINWIHLLIMGN